MCTSVVVHHLVVYLFHELVDHLSKRVLSVSEHHVWLLLALWPHGRAQQHAKSFLFSEIRGSSKTIWLIRTWLSAARQMLTCSHALCPARHLHVGLGCEVQEVDGLRAQVQHKGSQRTTTAS